MLAGPRRLLLVPGAGHNQSLSAPAAWVDIERWIEESLELVDRRLAGTVREMKAVTAGSSDPAGAPGV